MSGSDHDLAWGTGSKSLSAHGSRATAANQERRLTPDTVARQIIVDVAHTLLRIPAEQVGRGPGPERLDAGLVGSHISGVGAGGAATPTGTKTISSASEAAAVQLAARRLVFKTLGRERRSVLSRREMPLAVGLARWALSRSASHVMAFAHEPGMPL
jgi:hypothetical protein